MVITDTEIAIAMLICDGLALSMVIHAVGGIKEFLSTFVDIRDTIKDWNKIPKSNIMDMFNDEEPKENGIIIEETKQ